MKTMKFFKLATLLAFMMMCLYSQAQVKVNELDSIEAASVDGEDYWWFIDSDAASPKSRRFSMYQNRVWLSDFFADQISFGTYTQIPVTNVTGDDFDYSSNFFFQSSGSLGIQTSSSTGNGAISIRNSSSGRNLIFRVYSTSNAGTIFGTKAAADYSVITSGLSNQKGLIIGMITNHGIQFAANNEVKARLDSLGNWDFENNDLDAGTGTITVDNISSSTANSDLTLSGNGTGDIVANSDLKGDGASDFNISQSTADASDNQQTRIGGGGATSTNRGAVLVLAGNEEASPGVAVLSSGNVSGNQLILQTGGTAALTIDENQEATFSGDVELSSDDPIITLRDDTDSRPGVIKMSSSNLRIWSAGASADLGTITFATGSGAGTDRFVIEGDGGVVIGSPTGGNQGSGTLNATGVYDDGVLLTDYVFEMEFLGHAKDEHGKAFQRKSLADEADYVMQNMSLSTLPSREEWEKKRPSLGELQNKIYETIEVQFIYILELEKRIKELESEVKK